MTKRDGVWVLMIDRTDPEGVTHAEIEAAFSTHTDLSRWVGENGGWSKDGGTRWYAFAPFAGVLAAAGERGA